MKFAEIIQTIEEMKRDESCNIYNSLIEREIALDKMEAINDALDEVIDYLKSLQVQNEFIYR